MFKCIYNKSTWRSESYHFHFDTNSATEPSSVMKGWFVNKNSENYRLCIIDQYGNPVEAMTCFKNRPRLAELYPNIKDVTLSGFEVDMSCFSADQSYFLAVYKGNIEQFKVVSFIPKEPLLYVHIAKTAGSTVNKVVSEWFGKQRSLIHAESKQNWKELVRQQKIDYLSGHIPYKAFMRGPELRSYKKAITFREPYSHVISHLSWIRALALEENRKRYEAHPEYIQKLSDKLASYDLAFPEQITDVIKHFEHSEHRLLDNTQTRYIRTELAKETVDETDLIAAVENLKDFDFIGTDHDISGFLGELATEYDVEYKAEDRRENVLNNKFGLDINNPKIKDALLPLVKYDLELYAALVMTKADKSSAS